MLTRRLWPLRTIWLISPLGLIALIGLIGLGAIGLAVVLAGGQACTERSERDGQRPVRADVDLAPQALVRTPPGEDWPSYNGDYSGRRYTALDQITPENVHQLRARWVFHSTNSDSLEVTPVVVHGVMYVTSGNDAFALDARTGRVLWHHTRALTEGLIDDASAHHNRGVGVWHTRVFMETDNAHLLCLDARSGNLIWDSAYADTRKNYGATSAPLVVKDKVIVGTSGGDDGVRGFLAAFDALTGRLVWRFWTIPAPGEPGGDSWPGDAYLHGGGTTWMPGTYDPDLNTLYWGTSNPAPDFTGDTRPGDDLYTDCVLALDADTGKLKWYFQFTPHDLFDYDAAETPVLVDVALDGRLRHLLVEANRNGFFYILDRENGKFLSATRFAEKLNWATGIDERGRPILTGVHPTPQGAKICPSMDGATNWYSPSYNPSTQLFYFLALERCDMYFSGARREAYRPGRTYYNTGTERIPSEPGRKVLLAYSVATGKLVWRYPQVGEGHSWGGTMTTATGLVFFGDDAGELEAVDAKNGQPLWHFNTGQVIHASPMSYAVDGVQYVAVASGSDVFSFALPF
ncbi:MAG: PQQ-dependent dehydrogenase, methanol/ethanol family [Acidobacteria bacterium]|nr:MAG: PQQ-dependent dehydrogenase, methanol/ethanol family [Acidobacteriota bacterium]